MESSQGSGTFVAHGAHLETYRDYHRQEIRVQKKYPEAGSKIDMIDFITGIPDLSLVPKKKWMKRVREIIMDGPESCFNYGYPDGFPELRFSLAKFLLKTKGIRCHPDQIVVVSGSSQAFWVIANILTVQSDQVIIEDPLYRGIRNIFRSLRLNLYPISVDEDGLKTDLLPLNSHVKFISVTPSHQFPLGCVLPIQRRIRLLEYAEQMEIFVVENDYDSEFRYSGSPISTLHRLDPERVIHIGTFSESLFPSLRIGYMILPMELVAGCRNFLEANSIEASVLNQAVLTKFINDGCLERHILKMKKVYRKKRLTLIECLKEAFGDQIRVLGDSAGLYVVVEFSKVIFSAEMMEKLSKRKVVVYPVEEHAMLKGLHENKILFGYGNLSINRIPEGVGRVKAAILNEA